MSGTADKGPSLILGHVTCLADTSHSDFSEVQRKTELSPENTVRAVFTDIRTWDCKGVIRITSSGLVSKAKGPRVALISVSVCCDNYFYFRRSTIPLFQRLL